MTSRILRHLSLSSVILLSACSRPSASPAPFFRALQSFLDSDSLVMEGSLDWNGIRGNLLVAYAKEGPRLSFSMSSYSLYMEGNDVWILENGTVTTSDASAQGLENFRISSWNPFRSLDSQQREDLFSSVTLDRDTYTMTFKNSEISRLMDSYGAIQAKRATLVARLDGDVLENLEFTLEGSLLYGEGSETELSFDLACMQDAAFPAPEWISE